MKELIIITIAVAILGFIAWVFGYLYGAVEGYIKLLRMKPKLFQKIHSMIADREKALSAPRLTLGEMCELRKEIRLLESLL